MPAKDTESEVVADDARPAATTHTDDARDDKNASSPKEIGGRKGPDPTRYGDWEKAGRCIDF